MADLNFPLLLLFLFNTLKLQWVTLIILGSGKGRKTREKGGNKERKVKGYLGRLCPSPQPTFNSHPISHLPAHVIAFRHPHIFASMRFNIVRDFFYQFFQLSQISPPPLYFLFSLSSSSFFSLLLQILLVSKIVTLIYHLNCCRYWIFSFSSFRVGVSTLWNYPVFKDCHTIIFRHSQLSLFIQFKHSFVITLILHWTNNNF